MSHFCKPIRIDPALEEPEQVRALFAQHAPYTAIAAYQLDRPHDVDRPSGETAEPTVQPWFRGNWAADGRPLVPSVEKILYNERFLDAARAFFGTSTLRPTFIVVNVNAPMPAAPPHVDIPTFHGATRDQYPLRFLKAMGASGLFEPWRIIQAGAVCWFYDGPGGAFEYWPEGLHGPMLAEGPPFSNVAIMADNDRMYHRIGRVGDAEAESPRITSAAEIRPIDHDAWAIVENGETRAVYPSNAICLSLVWKANLETETQLEPLNVDHVMDLLGANLRQRNVDFRFPASPLCDEEWMTLLDRIYCEDGGLRPYR